MSKYIDRDMTEQALIKEAAFIIRKMPYITITDFVDRMIKIVQGIPAADVAPAVELEDLRAKYQALVAEKDKNSGDTAETYTTGYRYGHRNGQIELLQQILGIFDGTSEPEETNE
jgi:hypothetical protein